MKKLFGIILILGLNLYASSGLAAFKEEQLEAILEECRGKSIPILQEIIDAAEQGDVCMQLFLGVSYRAGVNEFPKDDMQALKWLRKAAVQGHPHAWTHLGAMYQFGLGVKKLRVVALALYILSGVNLWQTGVAEGLSQEEIRAAGKLGLKLWESESFLQTLDEYVTNPLVNEK